MISTLGFTGMDRATQDALSRAFTDAVSRLALDLRVVDSAEADVVVVDMDSLYGPMSWMQLHNAGHKVIGYSASMRNQADYRLQRGFDAAALDALLGELGLGKQAAPAPPAGIGTPRALEAFDLESLELEPLADAPHRSGLRAMESVELEPLYPGPLATPHGFTTAPAPADVLPEETPVRTEEEAPAAAVVQQPIIETTPGSVAEPAPTRDPLLADWLQPGRLHGRVLYRRDAGPALYIDADAGHYHGPATLKPLAEYFAGTVEEGDFIALDEARWQAEATGPAQPLARLAWYAALLEGRGALLPRFDAEGRYRMTKWLQTEREFPKHFRIATAMMKGPATLAEIIAAANVDGAEVADFVNAGLASEIVEPVLPEPPAAAEPPRSGLFGLKRGR